MEDKHTTPSTEEILDSIERENEVIRIRQEQLNARIEANNPEDTERYYRSGVGMVDQFLQKVQTDAFRPVSSGFASIDKRIGGGFVRQSVILLGASPGLGKTMLISQICEHMAREGHPVLYFNLEMSRDMMLARSISRIAKQEYGYTVTPTEVLKGYEWNERRADIVMKSAEIYKDSIARTLVYNPKDKETNLDAIMAEIEKRRDELLKQGYDAPIVCIDYLQLVTGRTDEDTIAVIKRTMMELKDYANRNNTLVFAIIANNRESTKTGRADLTSGRDSSNIEYGADLHLGLEYEVLSTRIQRDSTGWKKGETKDLEYISAVRSKYLEYMDSIKQYGNLFADEYGNIAQEYKECCTRFVLRVNKNRYGDSEGRVLLIREGESSMFRELTQDEIDERRRERNLRTAQAKRI